MAWGAVVAILAVLATCVVIGASTAQTDQRQRLADARARWTATAPAHYRLVSTAGSGCTIDVEVHAEQVARINHQDSCMHPVRTVSDLFSLIDRGQVSVPCFFAGCACRIDITAVVSYDDAYGFPTAIALRSDRAPNWGDRSFWEYLLLRGHLPGCTRSGSSDVARVISFTPLR
jgi:hypothetical protein